jgi:Histidine kinase-, DNA gyrase B-, and HSP90-like ATPase
MGSRQKLQDAVNDRLGISITSDTARTVWNAGRFAMLAIASFIMHYLGWQARNRFLSHLPEMATIRPSGWPLRNSPNGIPRPNGIEAMKDTGGVLTVKSQLGEDGQIEIAVKDTGPGLPVGKADQIFDAFFTTKHQGSGMGLAISKSIVESHGGRIWANGNGGRGATFHFTLPAAPAETNPPVDAEEKGSA